MNLPPATVLDALIEQTRAARQQLHVLVERLQREKTIWERDAEALLLRARLTRAQRRRFHTHLLKMRTLRGR
jgi:hypothetical protein